MNQPDSKKIVYLTAGAAGMFCGSCMHDNTLARALTRQGHDVQLVPTYTPIRTDEQDVSADQVFFGGINVYLQQKIPLFRHIPRFVDRWLDRPGLIRRVSSRATNLKPAELGKLAVSMLRGSRGGQRKEVDRLCDWLAVDAKPDLILFTNVLIGGCIPAIRERLGVPAVVTLQGDDIFLDSLPDQYRQQALAEIQRVAKDVDRFVAHSDYYADFMSEYMSIPRSRISTTRLGLDVDEFDSDATLPAEDSESDDRPLTIGYFARLAPEKGLHVLVDAFIRLKQNAATSPDPKAVASARLRIAGWLGEQNRRWAESQFQKLRDAGLGEEFEHLGSPDLHEKADFFRGIDLLCVPTVYREPKGLYALEAMSSSVPVALPEHGAFPEMIADTGGGVLFTPESPGDLATTLAELLSDPGEMKRLGKRGCERVRKTRNADTMATEMWSILEQVIADHPQPAD